jgi:hypothetical protein
MSDKFEDMPDGAGKKATEADYKRVWLYMKSRNRKPSVRSIRDELKAQNYAPPSTAGSARWAKKLGLSETVERSETKAADKRVSNRRSSNKMVLPETPAEAAERVADKIETPAETVERTLTARMKALLAKDNTSTQMAIDENRTRMAFNIALLEFYAENPALLANVRDSAALIDAITVAAKLSGGASIDITLPQGGDQPTDGVSPGGHPMKTIGNIDTSLRDRFAAFQAQLRDAQGA